MSIFSSLLFAPATISELDCKAWARAFETTPSASFLAPSSSRCLASSVLCSSRSALSRNMIPCSILFLRSSKKTMSFLNTKWLSRNSTSKKFTDCASSSFQLIPKLVNSSVIYPELVVLRIPQDDPEYIEWVEGVHKINNKRHHKGVNGNGFREGNNKDHSCLDL